jgi:hypothetical protein
MKYAVDIGFGAMIQIPSFIKTHKQHGDVILLFFKNKESMLITCIPQITVVIIVLHLRKVRDSILGRNTHYPH